ncbi:hypothetical protein DPMN_138374 [Dreissena polymorpha]|uniref:Dynein heavy chain C-terminal domain-containing protein n=1 Tax=Dreissena polymorpha TaxID=45954 RepID=A0A9D4JJR9_DREPO|nr:hypothetical protein DPMN_138374 [Dreissena polymorpha]
MREKAEELKEGGGLTESRPKELYTDLLVLWLKPEANRKTPTTGIYDCPCYKTLIRADQPAHPHRLVWGREGEIICLKKNVGGGGGIMWGGYNGGGDIMWGVGMRGGHNMFKKNWGRGVNWGKGGIM